MTQRAVIIGLLASAAFAAIGFFNDMVMKQTFLFSSYMPAFVYGLLILFVLFCNPILARVSNALPLRRAELATILVLTFPACFVSGRTLIHHFPAAIITPKHYNRVLPGWQRYDLLRRVPSVMMAGYEPELTADDVLQPEKLRLRLARARRAAGDSIEAQLAKALGDRPAAALSAADLARQINRALRRPDLFDAGRLDHATLPAPARRMLDTRFFNDRERRCFNRMLIDSAFPEELRNRLDREEAAVSAFQSGLHSDAGHIPIEAVPWGVWTRTLPQFWFPLLLALCAAFLGFALVAQRQWSEHELLPFPIAKFTDAILPAADGTAGPSLFRSRAFWITAAVIALFHLNNYGARWWPHTLVAIPRDFDLSPLAGLLPIHWNSWRLFNPIFYFTIIGIAYFISSEASLSAGLAPFAYALICGVFAGYGVSLSNGWNSTSSTNYVSLGGYFGMFLVLLYYGRRHFLCVLRRCLGRPARDPVLSHERWGARVFAAGAIVFVALLCAVGIRPVWAIWYFLLLLVVYSVVARVVAETGMILIHPVLFPGILATGLVGERLVGLDQIVPMVVLSTVIGVGCHVVMLPLMCQGLRIVRGNEGKAAAWCSVSLCIALAVAVPVAIYLQYDYGGRASGDGWTRGVSYMGIAAAERCATGLEAVGALDNEVAAARPAAPEARLRKPAVIAFCAAVAGVLVFEFLRLRFRGWPFHPVMFVMLDLWISRELAGSFLLGWMIKGTATRFGGTRAYQALKPVMLGLIAGDMLGQISITILCAFYSLCTGSRPIGYWVLPG